MVNKPKKKSQKIYKLMHSVCQQLYVQGSPVNVFMNQIDANLVLSLCNSALPPSSWLLFNPDEESPKLLKQWLAYRGVKPHNSNLSEQVKEDMHAKRNSPSMTGFVDFDVEEASVDFLRIWLSWFGLGSNRERSRAWWVKHAREAQEVRRSVEDHSEKHLRMQWRALVDMQKQMHLMVNAVVCSGAALAKESWAKEPEVLSAEPGVFAKYKDEPQVKKKNKKQWAKHAKELEVMTYASQIDVKKLLASAFNMAVVAAPLFYDPKKGLTLERVKTIKKEVSEYYDKADFKSSGGRSKALADLQSRIDPKLAGSGVTQAFKLAGMAEIAAAAGVILGDAFAGKPVDYYKASAKTPSSFGNTAAQLAVKALAPEPAKKPKTTVEEFATKIGQELRKQENS
jgi:hypothetical protein